MKNYLFILACFFSLLLVSCAKKSCNSGEKAIFKDMTGLDGCGMMIELLGGKRLEYTNIDDFEITPENGKKIWVKYETHQGGSVCMAGEMVEITCISER